MLVDLDVLDATLDQLYSSSSPTGIGSGNGGLGGSGSVTMSGGVRVADSGCNVGSVAAKKNVSGAAAADGAVDSASATNPAAQGANPIRTLPKVAEPVAAVAEVNSAHGDLDDLFD